MSQLKRKQRWLRGLNDAIASASSDMRLIPGMECGESGESVKHTRASFSAAAEAIQMPAGSGACCCCWRLSDTGVEDADADADTQQRQRIQQFRSSDVEGKLRPWSEQLASSSAMYTRNS